MKTRQLVIVLLVFVVLLIWACNATNLGSEQSSEIYLTYTAFAADSTKMVISPQMSPTVLPTFNIATSAVITIPASVTPTGAETEITETESTGGNSATHTATVDPNSTATLTATVVNTSADFETQMSDAKILILEDIVGNDELIPRLDRALDDMGLLDDDVVNMYDASGRFLDRLKTGEYWDLIIISIENRTPQRLGIWSDVLTHVDNHSALIVENYYINEISIGDITPFLESCGVRVQADWHRYEPYELYGYFVYAFFPDSPVFNTPNKIEVPIRPEVYWMGDVGDIMITIPDSTATILGGVYTDDYTENGLLTTCFDGRVILQTFSSHDYPKDVSIDLWQNYITYTLKHHFEAME